MFYCYFLKLTFIYYCKFKNTDGDELKQVLNAVFDSLEVATKETNLLTSTTDVVADNDVNKPICKII